MRTAFLITQYYPKSGKSTLGIYSEPNLSFTEELPISIVLDQESASSYEEARHKLFNRIYSKLDIGKGVLVSPESIKKYNVNIIH
jgi:hypothetical protein